MAAATSKKQSPAYWAWANMKKRCNSENHKDAHRYKGRGISYDAKWETFEGFCEDMLSTYERGLTLDRRDNDKGYSADNCRWATLKQQANNQSTNRRITIDGITKNLSQWCDEAKVKPSTVRQRYYVYGWSVEKSLGLSF
jgi:hypothetical protein